MSRIRNKLSMLVLALVFSAFVFTPNIQAQSVVPAQATGLAASAAFAESLTAEQAASIEKVLQKYKAELEAAIGDTSGNATAAKPVFLPFVQGGNATQSSAAAGPSLKRDLAVEKQAENFSKVQHQANKEIRAILTAEQVGLFDQMFSGQLLTDQSELLVQSANADVNTYNCYYAYYYGYYTEYYADYANYYAYWAYYYGNATYAYYAYYYGYYADYYAYYAYANGYYCYYG